MLARSDGETYTLLEDELASSIWRSRCAFRLGSNKTHGTLVRYWLKAAITVTRVMMLTSWYGYLRYSFRSELFSTEETDLGGLDVCASWQVKPWGHDIITRGKILTDAAQTLLLPNAWLRPVVVNSRVFSWEISCTIVREISRKETVTFLKISTGNFRTFSGHKLCGKIKRKCSEFGTDFWRAFTTESSCHYRPSSKRALFTVHYSQCAF